jgi:CRP-like cAMP-binding protein
MVCSDFSQNLKTIEHQIQFMRRASLPLDGRRVWKIQAGCVRATTWDEEGSMATLGFWRSGDIVGAFQSRIVPFRIECLMPVQATPVPPGQIHESVLLLSCFDQTQELLQITSHRRVEARLVNFLHWLGSRFGDRVDEGYAIDLRLTHQDIADAIRSSRVTVTRLLLQLQHEGKLQWNRQACVLLESLKSQAA